MFALSSGLKPLNVCDRFATVLAGNARNSENCGAHHFHYVMRYYFTRCRAFWLAQMTWAPAFAMCCSTLCISADFHKSFRLHARTRGPLAASDERTAAPFE